MIWRKPTRIITEPRNRLRIAASRDEVLTYSGKLSIRVPSKVSPSSHTTPLDLEILLENPLWEKILEPSSKMLKKTQGCPLPSTIMESISRLAPGLFRGMRLRAIRSFSAQTTARDCRTAWEKVSRSLSPNRAPRDTEVVVPVT